MSIVSVRARSKFLIAGLLAVFVALPASAQFRAALQGTVVDTNGGLVPDATVTLTSQETNAARNQQSSDTGVFAFTNLAPGRYALAVDKPGFSRKTLANVEVSAEQSQSIRVELAVGNTTQSVTVAGDAAQVIDTETATIGGTITTREVQTLPSFSRDPYQLLQLAPGVFGDASVGAGGGGTNLPGTNKSSPGATESIFQVENGPGIIANGTRQNSNNFQIDGLSVNSTVWGGSAVVTPNEESVKEVRVIANNYNAENGRTSGAQVEVVSQNGTNDVHGSAFFKWHRPGLNAYQAYNGPGSPSPVQRDNARFNQFGGSVGGPVWKNKLFAFFSYETLRDSSISTATGWYQTPQFLANAGPSGSIARQFLSYPGTAPVGTPITFTCAQAGLTSSQCHDVPGGLDLGSPLTSPLGTADPTYGQPGTPYGIGNGFDGVPDVMFVNTQAPNSNTNVQYNGRMDYNASSKDALVFSIYWVPVTTFSYNGPAREANAWHHQSIANAMSGIYTHTFGPTLINEARFGVSGWNWNEIATNPQEPFGLPTANFTAAGGINYQYLGAPGPSVFNQKTYNARDTLTKVQGSQYLKFGADYSRALFLDTAPWGGRPNYDFYNIWDFANDAPHDETGNFNPVTGTPTSATKNIRFNITAFFAQDDWKVKPNLTLNLGLRWENFSPLKETNGNISNVILGGGPYTLTGLSIRKGGDLYKTPLNNFGPQLGFAWSPTGVLGHAFQNRFVLRGGFGIGYNLEQLAITSNGRFNPPFLTSFTLYNNNILYAPSSGITDLNGYPSNPATLQQFSPNTGLPTSGAPLNLTGFPEYTPSTMTLRYSMEAQYDLGHSWVASLGYQGQQSRHYTIQTNLNYLLYPESNPRVNSLDWYANEANSSFNALLAELKHRFAQTFQIDAQYRYAGSQDQGSQDYYTDPYPWDLSHSKGPSDFDVKNDLKLYGIWSPRIFGGHGLAGSLLGGWTISGIFNAHSGFPWTPDYCNTSGNVVYPNSGYGCLYPAAYSGGAGSDYSNSTFEKPNGNFPNGSLAYFTVPTWPTTGIPPDPAASIHRNMFRGPGYISTDLTLAKAFALPRWKFMGENARLNLQASAYNLFNNVNLTPLSGASTAISNDGVTSNPQFGQAQGAYGGRIIELQARFSF